MVLFFLPDLAGAAKRYVTLLRPGGRLVLSAFAMDDDRWATVNDLLASFVPEDRRPPSKPPAGSPFESRQSLVAFLTEAGFATVRTIDKPQVTTIASPEQWWVWSWSHGRRAVLERLDKAALAEATPRVNAAMETLREPDGTFEVRPVFRYTVATAPS